MMLIPGNGTGYDWGNLNWALGRYNDTKTLTEFLAKVKLDYPNADPRDYELMWQAFDICAEHNRASSNA